MKKQVMFYRNGTTVVLGEDGLPMTSLQRSWVQLFLDYLDEHDEDPTEFEFITGDGQQVKVLETESGYDLQYEQRSKGKKLTPAKHRAVHEELHGMLDELLADFIIHTKRTLRETTLLEFLEWSHQQTISPTEEGDDHVPTSTPGPEESHGSS